MFLFVFLVLSLLSLIYLWQKKVYNFWIDIGLPQVPPIFPIGTIEVSKNYVYGNDDAYKRYKATTKYVGMYNIVSPMLLVLDEEAAKQILVKDFQYTQYRGAYHNEVDDPLSAHLFAIEGKAWKDMRTKLTPTFTSGKMKTMFPIVVDIGNRFKQTMDEKIESGETGIDMRDMFARFTTDVIGTCAFGLECNSLNDPDAEFRKMGFKMFDQPRHHMGVVFCMMAYPNFARRLGMKFIPDDVSEFFFKAVQDTVSHRTTNNIQRNDFMDLLIALRKEGTGLTIEQLAAQCFVFFIAGFETSSTASSFTIFELARNQGVQDKLRTHIRSVLEKHNGELTYEALKDFTYLDQCINESMRKYPPLPMLNRVTVQDYKLPDSDAVIPKGTMIVIPIYSIQNDPENFPDPERYDPDRFTPEEAAKRHPFAFLPFGEGPRNCIGERFGMMQAKIGMISLLKDYRFTLNPRTKPVINFKREAIILTPTEELYFDVEKV